MLPSSILVFATSVAASIGSTVGREAAVPAWPVADERVERVQRLYRNRIELLLEDLRRRSDLGEAELQRARLGLYEAADAFCARDRRSSRAPQFGASIPFEPFGRFLADKLWEEAVHETLPVSARMSLRRRIEERQERLVASLIDLMDIKLAIGLCLGAEDRDRVRGVVRRTADLHLLDPLVWTEELPVEPAPNRTGIRFVTLLDEAGLGKALDRRRGRAFRDLKVNGRRSERSSYELEAEFLLSGQADSKRKRRLLLGGAEALLHRDGRQPSSDTRLFYPTIRRTRVWEKLARGVLELEEGERLPDRPASRSKEYRRCRAGFVLAVLDELLCFSDAQLEAVEPLIDDLVAAERTRSSDMELYLPEGMGIHPDGFFLRESFREGASRRTASLVEALRELCTEVQLEVMSP